MGSEKVAKKALGLNFFDSWGKGVKNFAFLGIIPHIPHMPTYILNSRVCKYRIEYRPDTYLDTIFEYRKVSRYNVKNCIFICNVSVKISFRYDTIVSVQKIVINKSEPDFKNN